MSNDLSDETKEYVRSLVDFPDAYHPANPKELAEYIGSHDVVIGVWPDGADFDWLTIKGKGRLMLYPQGASARAPSVAGVRCQSIEEAESMRLVLGDGRPEYQP